MDDSAAMICDDMKEKGRRRNVDVASIDAKRDKINRDTYIALFEL